MQWQKLPEAAKDQTLIEAGRRCGSRDR